MSGYEVGYTSKKQQSPSVGGAAYSDFFEDYFDVQELDGSRQRYAVSKKVGTALNTLNTKLKSDAKIKTSTFEDAVGEVEDTILEISKLTDNQNVGQSNSIYEKIKSLVSQINDKTEEVTQLKTKVDDLIENYNSAVLGGNNPLPRTTIDERVDTLSKIVDQTKEMTGKVDNLIDDYNNGAVLGNNNPLPRTTIGEKVKALSDIVEQTKKMTEKVDSLVADFYREVLENNTPLPSSFEQKVKALSEISEHVKGVATKVKSSDLKEFYTQKQTLGSGTKMEEKIETLVSTALSTKEEIDRKDELSKSDHIRELLSVMNVLLVVVTSISYAAFWTNASRLYTDPAIIAGIKDYGCSNESTVLNSTSTFTTISSITAQSMIFDFIKNYICIMIVPSTFLWYSYYIEDSETRQLKNDGYSKTAYFFMWLSLLFASAISFLSLALFGWSMHDYNHCGSEKTQPKFELGFGLLACALTNFGIWSFNTFFLQWVFIRTTDKAKRNPNEKHTLCNAWETLFCACCIYGPKNMCRDLCCVSCCSSKRAEYFVGK